MKKIILASLIAISIMGFKHSAVAQSKIGYLNVEELIGSMPEAEAAGKQLDSYKNALQQQYNEYMGELNDKDSIFRADSLKYSAEKKEVKLNELKEVYDKIQKFNASVEQKIGEKQQSLLIPIRTKALDAVKAVAKESGYAYILDETSVIVGPPGENVLPLVKKKLGIKDPAPTAKPKEN
ncbi:MAG: OmpH family outer membrane protein [Ferruginibacter sp.]